MSIALDPIGNISLSLQIVILFLLIIGLPFFRKNPNKKNWLFHGYLTVSALVLHSVLIFLVMVPSFSEGISELGELALLSSVTVWSHIVLGTLAEVVGIIIVVLWLAKGPSKLACIKYKKIMIPLFIIWVISIINGALIHILGLL